MRRLNALLAEREEAIQDADGWLTGTSPAWRADWKARMDALLSDMAAHDAGWVGAK